MDVEYQKIVKQYFNKYFKAQYFNENDHEFKALVRILNKKDKVVKNLTIPRVSFSEARAEVCEIKDCNLRVYGDLKVCKHHFLEEMDKQT